MNVGSYASAASSLSQAQLGREVAVRVARKSQDVVEQQGRAAIDLLSQAASTQKQLFAAEPHKGNAIDVRA